MKFENIKVGDRVSIKSPSIDIYHDRVGTVVSINDKYVSVKFDKRDTDFDIIDGNLYKIDINKSWFINSIKETVDKNVKINTFEDLLPGIRVKINMPGCDLYHNKVATIISNEDDKLFISIDGDTKTKLFFDNLADFDGNTYSVLKPAIIKTQNKKSITSLFIVGLAFGLASKVLNANHSNSIVKLERKNEL